MKNKRVAFFVTFILVIALQISTMAAMPAMPENPNKPTNYIAKTTEEDSNKMKLATQYVKEKRKMYTQKIDTISVKSYGGMKLNYVGQNRQPDTWSCGPHSALNLITGFWMRRGDLNGTLPSINDLVIGLNTNQQDGTAFEGNFAAWEDNLNYCAPGNNYVAITGYSWPATWASYELTYRVIYTIDRTFEDFNVIANIRYNSVGYSPISPCYDYPPIDPVKFGHFVCIYGYDDVNQRYYVADSWYQALMLYTCPYNSMSNSTYKAGIIW